MGDLTVEQRIPFLESFADHLKDRLETLADAISRETGKPHWESISEVNAMIQKIPLSIEAYYVRCTERIREQGAALSMTRHKPHGVLAVFGPFNFPCHLPNGHIVPALLAGNAIMFKPQRVCPLDRRNNQTMLGSWPVCLTAYSLWCRGDATSVHGWPHIPDSMACCLPAAGRRVICLASNGRRSPASSWPSRWAATIP